MKDLNSALNLVYDEVILNQRQKHKMLIERKKQTHKLILVFLVFVVFYSSVSSVILLFDCFYLKWFGRPSEGQHWKLIEGESLFREGCWTNTCRGGQCMGCLGVENKKGVFSKICIYRWIKIQNFYYRAFKNNVCIFTHPGNTIL